MASLQRPYRVTIDDVARRAGVSISTVSRVINRTVPVSREAASRVEAAMRELNYRPRAAARNLATRKTHTVGLLISGIEGDFFAPLFSGIESMTSEAGYDLLISTSGRLGPRDDFPTSLGAHNADGLLVFANSLGPAGLAQCHEMGFPIVLIHQSPPDGLDIPCVTVENRAASRRLVEHLIEVHGRRRIAFLRGPEGHEDSFWRETGYRKALEGQGIPFDPALVADGDFDRRVAQASVEAMLARGVDMDAIFCGDDEAAIGVLAAFQEAGRRVPEEIAVVGFDDLRSSAHLTPPLTTVRAPTEEVGREAARQLLNLLRTGQAQSLTLLPTEILIRRSCGCREG
jgi:LacI family transcriptional regulator, galactose operon repressor